MSNDKAPVRFECKLCDYTPSRNTHLQRHLKSELHAGRVKQADKLKRFTVYGPYHPVAGFYCPMCDYRTHSLTEITDHVYRPTHMDDFDTWLQEEYDREVEKLTDQCLDWYDLTINEYGQVFVQTFD